MHLDNFAGLASKVRALKDANLEPDKYIVGLANLFNAPAFKEMKAFDLEHLLSWYPVASGGERIIIRFLLTVYNPYDAREAYATPNNGFSALDFIDAAKSLGDDDRAIIAAWMYFPHCP